MAAPMATGAAVEEGGSAGSRGAGKEERRGVAEVKVPPARSGEEPWTAEELAEVRASLEADVVRLREQLAEAQSELAEWSADAVSNAGDDPTDTGAKAYQREHDLALSYNIRDLLAQSERAIGRMDAGTYGVCASCGQAIGKARLQAYPRALLCVTCKQREERR